jgi:hypothetical protein
MQRHGVDLPFKVDPILVRKNDDIMCFSVSLPSNGQMFTGPNHSLPLTKFMYVVDPALKVHASIYSLIDQKLSKKNVTPEALLNSKNITPEVPFETGKDLVFIYHNGSTIEEDRRASKIYISKVRDMQRYELKKLQQFFWSAQSTRTHFLTSLRSLTTEEALDRKRASAWSYLAHYLEIDLMRSRAMANGPVHHVDPCGFSKVKPRMQKVTLCTLHICLLRTA